MAVTETSGLVIEKTRKMVGDRRRVAGALDAEALLEGDLAVAADQQVGAGDLARGDVGLQSGPRHVQLRRIES
jgi:hypothetical protein